MHLVRRAHLFSGLFLLPWVLVYGVSAFLFNHPGAFPDQPTRSFGAEAIRGTPLESLPRPDELARQVVEALREREAARGESPSYRLVQPERAAFARDRVLVLARGGGLDHSIAVDLGSGTGTVRSRSAGEPEAPAPFAVPGGVRVTPSLPKQLQQAVPQVLSRLDLPVDEVTIPGALPDLIFYLEADGRRWRAAYQPQRGSVSGKPADAPSERMSAQRFLKQLHLAHGYPAGVGTRWFWAVLVDALFVALVFWGLSGLLMWWQLKRVRFWGAVTLLASAAATAWLALGMYGVLSP
jgi:hypothetical protein